MIAEEMPKHNHGLLSVLDLAPLPKLPDPNRHVAIAGKYNSTYLRDFGVGQGEPHNDMSPFIALYYYRKD